MMKHYSLFVIPFLVLCRGKNLLPTQVLCCCCAVAMTLITASAQVLDLTGSVVEPLKIQSQNTIVLIFVRTDCPLSPRYAPEIKRLTEKFALANMKFYLIYPGADETVEAIRNHRQAYDYKLESLRDPKHQLVKTTGVAVTPEVAVLHQGRWLYRGRIDNRFVTFGKLRPAPTIHDLEQLLEALRTGKSVKKRSTTAIGCFI